MPVNQNLSIDQRIGMRLSQQQLRFVRLLELNAPELDDAVDKELEDNPALGIDTEAEETPAPGEKDLNAGLPYRPAYSRYQGDGDREFTPREAQESLYDHLYRQLDERNLDMETETVARYIIGNLDSNGYLRRPLPNLVDDLAFGEGVDIGIDKAREALEVVRQLEPHGVGASSLRECLAIQLEAMPESEVRNDALDVITKAYEPFAMKHKHRIMSQLKLSESRTDAALALILTLNPKPGASFSNETEDAANIIVPDFNISNEDGNIVVTLNNNIPELRIEQSFEEAMANLDRTAKGRAKKGSEFIVSRYNDARDFIKVLRQRQETMMLVMSAIVKIQKDYFLTEDIYRLKPMMIKTISELTGLDLSVISRATANKFVATPWGIFPLRFFFSDSIGEGEGDDAVTNRKIEAEIEAIVNEEDKRHPLSDKRIMEEMTKRGFEVSRRTVAKYRDRKGIPVARLRKEL